MEKQIKRHKNLHFTNTKSLRMTFPELIQEYFKNIFVLLRSSTNKFQVFEIMEPQFMLFGCSFYGRYR